MAILKEMHIVSVKERRGNLYLSTGSLLESDKKGHTGRNHIYIWTYTQIYSHNCGGQLTYNQHQQQHQASSIFGEQPLSVGIFALRRPTIAPVTITTAVLRAYISGKSYYDLQTTLALFACSFAVNDLGVGRGLSLPSPKTIERMQIC